MRLAETLSGSPEDAAPYILGSILQTNFGGETVSVRLTEAEAYKGSDDPASHAYKGRNQRNGSMFDRPGTLYVYRSYGVHWCANVAAGPAGTGWGILFRAGEVIEGFEIARRRRGGKDDLANGPGKLCQALGITGADDGMFLLEGAGPASLSSGAPPDVVMATPRIGISKATDRSWRFVAATTIAPVA